MKAKKAHIVDLLGRYEQAETRDVYSEHGIDELFDDDELTSVEEGFLKGYLAG